MPEVSIIMPVYNKEKYLRDSLESVLNQTFSDFELIVVNDGSTDNSLDIIQEIASQDSRIKVFTQENKGVSAARNLGLEKASGNWIQFLDGDDLICKDYLSNCIPVAAEKEIDILFTGFENINSQNEIVEIIKIHNENEEIDSERLYSLFLQYQFSNGFFGFISNKLIRHDLIRKSGNRFDESLKLAEDLDFYVRLYEIMKKGYLSNQISFQYLHNEDNDFSKREIDYYSQLIVLNNIKQTIPKGFDISIINLKITDHTYYYLLNESSNDRTLLRAIQTIQNNSSIMNSLYMPKNNSFKAEVIKLLKQKKMNTLYWLFKIRRTIRDLYGLFRKRES